MANRQTAASSDNKWYSELFKIKTVKYCAIIVAIAITVFVLFILGKILFGYNVKIGSFESNPDKPKLETAYVKTNLPILSANDDTVTYISNTKANKKSNEVKLYYPKFKPEKTKYTISDSTPRNVTTYSGNNAHVVNGNNSGINGDVYRDIRLHEEDQVQILSMFKHLSDTMKVRPNCVSVSLHSQSNGQLLSADIINFLNSKGFTTNSSAATLMSANFNGVRVEMLGGCYHIAIGTLTPYPNN